MTPIKLKYQVLAAFPDSHFFDRRTMKVFGDTMRNYGVRKSTIMGCAVWELYRKRPVKEGQQASAYFNAGTLEQVWL